MFHQPSKVNPLQFNILEGGGAAEYQQQYQVQEMLTVPQGCLGSRCRNGLSSGLEACGLKSGWEGRHRSSLPSGLEVHGPRGAFLFYFGMERVFRISNVLYCQECRSASLYSSVWENSSPTQKALLIFLLFSCPCNLYHCLDPPHKRARGLSSLLWKENTVLEPLFVCVTSQITELLFFICTYTCGYYFRIVVHAFNMLINKYVRCVIMSLENPFL